MSQATEENMRVGGWSTYSYEITPQASAAFKEAFEGFVGVSYEPVAFATQIVSGSNYSFFCNAKVVYPGASNEAAIVCIYKPLDGKAHIKEIRRVPQC